MQPEQPNTPSTDVQTSDAPVAEASSQEQPEGSSPGWWQRLFHREPAPQETETAAQDSQSADAASKTLALTQEELERRIQSEADRREAKRNQEARAKAKRDLRDKDPWAYAQMEREDEQVQDQTVGVQQFFSNIGTAHDRVSIDPLVLSLPEQERQRILAIEGAGSGLEGRKLVVSESLKALEKHWKAEGAKEAESRLRRNSAFRKQVLTEVRGTSPEPELLPSAGGGGSDDGVSAILRGYYGLQSG